MKLSKLDPKPLRSALESVRKAQAEITAGRERKTALEKEVKDFLETTQMADDEAVQLVNGRRLQAEMLGHILPRKEAALEPLVRALFNAVDAFESGLRAVADAEAAALTDKIAGLLRPYCSDYREAGDKVDAAQAIAKRCQVFRAFPSSRVMPQSLPVHMDTASRFEDVAQCAEAALAFHAKLEKAGGFVALNFNSSEAA